MKLKVMNKEVKINTNVDTIKLTDTTNTVFNNPKTVILVQEKSKEQVVKETDWLSSVLFPIIIALVGAGISYLINKRKTDAEIKKIKGDTKKTDAEIKKLNSENENLKKSFQPIVIATLQSIQDKIVPSKIEALKGLVKLKNELTYHEQQYDEGEPFIPKDNLYLDLLFYNFSYSNYEDYSTFYNNYSYLFPDKVFFILKEIKINITSLNETKTSFNSTGDPDLEASKRDRDEIEKIIKLFEEAILEIRKDCHLDTSFIHDFIEQNK